MVPLREWRYDELGTSRRASKKQKPILPGDRPRVDRAQLREPRVRTFCYCEQGENDDGFGVNCETLLQEKLLYLDPAEYPHITIQGASTCSKMRPDEFGGFAVFITRDTIRSISTWQWLHDQEQSSKTQPALSA